MFTNIVSNCVCLLFGAEQVVNSRFLELETAESEPKQ